MIGQLFEAQAEPDRARTQYERAVHLDPRAGVAANNLAWIRAQEGRLDEAMTLATTARDVLGSRAEVENTMGWILYRERNYGPAVASLRRAVEWAPQRARYHLHLGLAMRDAGDQVQARDAFERALALGLTPHEAADARAALQELDN
jgi:Flp pilus assembly protein TadD